MLRKLANNQVFQSISTVSEIFITIVLVVLILLTGFQRFSDAKSFFGYRIFTVATGSMIPMYEIGDTLLVKNVPIEDIHIGDAVTYSSELGGRPVNITHEVVDVELDERGKFNFHTKGIANNIEDPIVNEEQVVGKVIYKFFFLSILGYITTNKLMMLLVITIPIALLVAIEIIKILYREEEDARETKKEKQRIVRELSKEKNVLSSEEREKKIEAIRNGISYNTEHDKEKHLSEADIQKKIENIKNGKGSIIKNKEESSKNISDLFKDKEVETIDFESISDIKDADLPEEDKDLIAEEIKKLQSDNKDESKDELSKKMKELQEEYSKENSTDNPDIEEFLKYVKEKLSEDLPSDKKEK